MCTLYELLKAKCGFCGIQIISPDKSQVHSQVLPEAKDRDQWSPCRPFLQIYTVQWPDFRTAHIPFIILKA